ncbi:MAG: hypothetical protein IJA00_09470, partial [Bacteroidaceae bacterium]|nr:hypothetical protein [Bacteroidaceae bacterium]
MKKIVAFIAVLIYMTCAGTVWGQADYTSSIKNAGFDTYASTGSGDTKTADNWTFEVKNNYATNFTNINNCAEQWKRNFNFYQDVVNLPNGLYKVSVQGFYRDGGIGGANAKARKAYLYADEAEIPLMNILDEEGSGVTGGSTVSGYNSKFPNNITEASTAFTNNYYSDNSLYVMVSDYNLRIGIKKDETFDADWVCFDNFKLTYYGTSASFYLRNRQTGTFLTSGNNWGTQATLHETGIDFKLTLSNEKYTLNSGVSTNGSYLYPTNENAGFVDGALTEYVFKNVGGNYYAFSKDGSNNFFAANSNDTRTYFNINDPSSSHYAQWELLTKDDLVNELKGASFSNPKNATFFIQGFDFNRNDSRNTTKWGGSPSMNGYSDSEGGYKRYAEKKGGTNGSLFNVTQTLTGLPKGYYILTAQAFYRNGTDTENTNVNAYIYAGDQSVKVPAINDGGTIPVDTDAKGVADAFYNNRGRYKTTPLLAYVNSDNGSLPIGIKSDVAVANDWTAFDNFQLLYCGDLSGLYTGGGSYYLQNVATGEYLQGGMSYGTKIVLGNGIEFSLERQSNGTYRIGSGIASRTDYEYLCDEASIDHIATDFFITETSSGSGIYTISTTIDGCTGEGQANDGVSGRLLTAKDATFPIDLKYVHFNIWDSPLPGASCTKIRPDFAYNTNGDGLFYGTSTVDYLYYADISEYQSLTIKGTGGGKLRVLLNRTKDEGTVADGALTEEWLDMSSGSATLDLTKYPYAHLHAIKVGTGTVTVT